MRLIDADPIVEMLKNVRRKVKDNRRDLDLLNLQEIIQCAPTIAPPPNDPLTLEELREMDEEPVWVECLNNEDLSGFAIVDLCFNGIPTKYFYAYFDYYGDDWLAYRRKPEGETL